MQCQVVRAKCDVQLRRFLDRLDHWRSDSGHVLNCCLHLIRHALQRAQIVAVDLDCNLSVDARYHVTNQVSQWLLDLDINTRSFVANFLTKAGEDFIALCRRFGVHAQNVFTEVDGRCMLVHLGSAGSTNEVQNFAIRIVVSLLHRLKDGINRSRSFV